MKCVLMPTITAREPSASPRDFLQTPEDPSSTTFSARSINCAERGRLLDLLLRRARSEAEVVAPRDFTAGERGKLQQGLSDSLRLRRLLRPIMATRCGRYFAWLSAFELCVLLVGQLYIDTLLMPAHLCFAIARALSGLGQGSCRTSVDLGVEAAGNPVSTPGVRFADVRKDMHFEPPLHDIDRAGAGRVHVVAPCDFFPAGSCAKRQQLCAVDRCWESGTLTATADCRTASAKETSPSRRRASAASQGLRPRIIMSLSIGGTPRSGEPSTPDRTP